MKLGCTLSICSAMRPFGGYPSTLALSAWWKDYGGSPWPGSASLGASGTRPLSEATNPPTVLASGINGRSVASFDGTNDQLSHTTVGTDTFLTAAAGTIVCLFYAVAAAADSGAYYNNPGLVADIGFSSSPAMAYSSVGVQLGSYNGSSFNAVAVAAATGSWHLAIGRWNGTTKELSVDNGAFSSLVHSVVVSPPGGVGIGRDDNASTFFNGRIAEIMMMPTRISDPEVALLVTYFNQGYGLAL